MTTNRRTILAGVASIVWLSVASASAQGPDHPRGGRNADGGPQRMMEVEQRRPMMERDASAQGSGSRLSPEERRQLRRDVHEAGRDIYSDRTLPGRRESRRP